MPCLVRNIGFRRTNHWLSSSVRRKAAASITISVSLHDDNVATIIEGSSRDGRAVLQGPLPPSSARPPPGYAIDRTTRTIRLRRFRTPCSSGKTTAWSACWHKKDSCAKHLATPAPLRPPALHDGSRNVCLIEKVQKSTAHTSLPKNRGHGYTSRRRALRITEKSLLQGRQRDRPTSWHRSSLAADDR